jgi:hypothetical protein
VTKIFGKARPTIFLHNISFLQTTFRPAPQQPIAPACCNGSYTNGWAVQPDSTRTYAPAGSLPGAASDGYPARQSVDSTRTCAPVDPLPVAARDGYPASQSAEPNAVNNDVTSHSWSFCNRWRQRSLPVQQHRRGGDTGIDYYKSLFNTKWHKWPITVFFIFANRIRPDANVLYVLCFTSCRTPSQWARRNFNELNSIEFNFSCQLSTNRRTNKVHANNEKE